MRDDGSGNRRDKPPAPARTSPSAAAGQPSRPGGAPRTATAQVPQARTSTGHFPQARPPVASPRTTTGQVPQARPPVAPPRTTTGQVPQARTTTGQMPAASPRTTTGQLPQTQTRTSTGQIPVAAGSTGAAGRTQSTASQPRVPVTPPPRTSSGVAIPRTASSGGEVLIAPPKHLLARELGAVENAQQAQKQMLVSGFADDDEVTAFDALLGARRMAPAGEEEEVTSFAHQFDGLTAPAALQTRDLFKALNAPVQNREGRRSQEAYRLVLDQFAVGHNPRYEPDAPGKPRAHIFVWDVSRAMGVEIPHFLGSRELTVGQTVDWLRHEGPMKGWRRCNELEAWQAANAGHPVVVLPKEVRLKLMAMARPGEFNTDGKPFLSAAGLERGNGLSVKQAFNVFAVEFFVHA